MSAKSGWRTVDRAFRATQRGVREAASAMHKPLPGFFFNEDWMLAIVVGVVTYVLLTR